MAPDTVSQMCKNSSDLDCVGVLDAELLIDNIASRAVRCPRVWYNNEIGALMNVVIKSPFRFARVCSSFHPHNFTV